MNKQINFDLIINGYDWGPAVDKIIVHNNSVLNTDQLKIEDFTVTAQTYVYQWTSWPPKLELKNGPRNITGIYFCDEKGNKINGESSHFLLELSVHPEDPFSNPFLYGSDMMNHWQQIYNITLINEKLGMKTDQIKDRICPLADKFTIGQSSADNITLSYALFNPEKSDKKTPLIIWLHGMGEGGTDPYLALVGNKVVNLITDNIQQCFGETGAFVLVPQVDGFWMQTTLNSKKMEDWISEKSELTKSAYTNALFKLIEEIVNNNSEIDKSRIYIGGCSNGGYMTVNMLLEYPDYFAAAFPVCQAYPDCKIDEEKLNKLASQHIWFTQSKDDQTIYPEKYSIPTVKRLQNLKAQDIHFTLWDNVTDRTGNYKDKFNNPYKYNGHLSWIYVLNNQCFDNGKSIFEWMSKISK